MGFVQGRKATWEKGEGGSRVQVQIQASDRLMQAGTGRVMYGTRGTVSGAPTVRYGRGSASPHFLACSGAR